MPFRRKREERIYFVKMANLTEKDYAPLTAACVRALNDKLYEKRKTAALEIEK